MGDRDYKRRTDKMRFKIVLMALLALSLSTTARADDYTYSLNFTSNLTLPWGDPLTFAWTTMATPLLTETTAFSPAGLTSVIDDGCTIAATIVDPLSADPSVITLFEGVTTGDVACTDGVNGDWWFSQDFGSAGVFNGPGTYTVAVSGGEAVLTIANGGPGGGGGDSTPEPATLALSITGLIALWGARRSNRGGKCQP